MIKKRCLYVLSMLLLSMLCRAQFRFALISDTHITAHETPAEDLQRVVEHINKNQGIDFVLVTGDITDEGDSASLAKARSILDRLDLAYYIIPGNHETTWSASGMTAFGDIFGSERFRFEHKGFLFLGFNSGPFIRMADGHVSPQDIIWLKEELEKYGKEKPVVIVTHYPLKSPDVDNWYDVTDAIRPYNIRLCVGGHYHANHMLSYDGIPGFLNRSTLRGKEKEGGYSLYEITNDSVFVYEQLISATPRRWGALSLKSKVYDVHTRLDERPDFGVNTAYPDVHRVWLLQSGAGIYSSAVVADDRCYVGDDMGYMTCYRLKDGEKCWTFKSGHRIVGTPAVAENVVVFGSADQHIYGLNAQNGNELWKTAASAPVLGAVAISDGKAFIGTSDHVFRAIDIHSGRLSWAYNGVKGYVVTKPLVTDDKVIFGAWDNTLYALDKHSGAECWRWTGGLTRMHFSPASVWPVAAHGKVFITDPQRAFTAIDIESGETVYRTFRYTVRETIGLSEDASRVFSKTMNDSIVCFDATSDVPELLWASDVGFGYEHAPSMPQEKENVIFGGTKNGLLYGIEANSGALLWKHKIGNSLVNTVLPLGHNQVLLTTAAGEICLLEIVDPTIRK